MPIHCVLTLFEEDIKAVLNLRFCLTNYVHISCTGRTASFKSDYNNKNSDIKNSHLYKQYKTDSASFQPHDNPR